MAFTKEDFLKLVEDIQGQTWYKEPIGFGIARVDRGQLNKEKILQATFPVVNWKENSESAAIFLNALCEAGMNVDTSGSELICDVSEKFIDAALDSFRAFIPEAKGQEHKNVQVINYISEKLTTYDLNIENFKVVFIFEDTVVASVEAAYLKLYALSSGKAALRSLNLDGIFGALHNCAWEGITPIELDWLRENEISLKLTGSYPEITMVDKFPRFLSHVIPADNTRILETSKVRFGAQLAAGTTVMPGASYINFNAGTEGIVMVEGRISSSAVVGAGSDVGGGASILGVLSGTEGVPVSIGENTLLGANSCTGTAIGDSCIIDAGVTILPGTIIFVDYQEMKKIIDINTGINVKDFNKISPGIYNSVKQNGYLLKGKQFQGINGVHFRVNSKTGQTIAMRSTRKVELNADLH